MNNFLRFFRTSSSHLCLLLLLLVLVKPSFGHQVVDTLQTKSKKNDLKFTLLSIGSGSSRFTYERTFGRNMSAEITFGMIGWGYDFLHNTDAKGFLIKFAYKWNLVPMKRANSPLAGFYVKPEIQFVNFNYVERAYDDQPSVSNTHVTQCAILAECGYQLLLKWFVFDVYVGLGPTFGTGNTMNYFHGFMQMPHGSWLAATAGFRIGVAF